jgi:hypothetical protein
MLTYLNESEARRAVDILRATGAPAGEVLLLVGTRLRDVRDEPVGGFGGPVGPDAPVGAFAGPPLRRRQGAGAFAGDADAQRQGSFADSDRVVVVTYGEGRERARITGHRGARRLLRKAGLDDAAITRAIAELGTGHSVVLGGASVARRPQRAAATPCVSSM